MKTFTQFDLPKNLLKTLENMGFKAPTPIQEQTLTTTLSGQDLLGTAQTGTGKTGAFAIPMAAKLISNPKSAVLVLTPTRELAIQVSLVFSQLLASEKSIRIAQLIGGEFIGKQFKQLKSNPRVIIGTPGRINDHLERGTLNLSQVDSLVLDETDQMLDMGFDVQIAKIIKRITLPRQTLMFSATLPPKIEKAAGTYLQDPARVSVGARSEPGKNIKQETIKVTTEEKYDRLLEELDAREGSIIVFVKSKHGADRIATKLCKIKHKAASIHGDHRQSRRERILKEFRNKKHRILVATDVAARGIDVPHIRHVINYDLPQCPESYIHRIGRTARAGETGCALSFITNQEKAKWAAIERLLDPSKKPEKTGGKRRERSRGGSKENSSKRHRRGGGKPESQGRGGKPSSQNRNDSKKRFDSSKKKKKDGNFSRQENNGNAPFSKNNKRRNFKKPAAKKRG